MPQVGHVDGKEDTLQMGGLAQIFRRPTVLQADRLDFEPGRSIGGFSGIPLEESVVSRLVPTVVEDPAVHIPRPDGASSHLHTVNQRGVIGLPTPLIAE